MAFLWEKQAAEKAALLLEQLNPDHLPVSLVGELGAFSFREELRTLGWNCVETEKPFCVILCDPEKAEAVCKDARYVIAVFFNASHTERVLRTLVGDESGLPVPGSTARSMEIQMQKCGYVTVKENDVKGSIVTQEERTDSIYGDTLLRQFVEAFKKNTDPSADSVVLVRAFEKKESSQEQAHPFLTVLTRTQGQREQELREVFLCLAAQSCRDFEVLVVGHKVRPENRATVEHLIQETPEYLRSRIRYFPLETGGRTAPLNYGFSLAWGDYVAILDDDDIVMSDWVEQFQKAAQKAPGRLLHAYCVQQPWERLENGYLRAVGSCSPIHCKDFNWSKQFVENNCPPVSLAFPRYAFQELGLKFDESLDVTEDWDYTMRVAMYCGVQDISTVTSVYRMWKTGNSLSLHGRSQWDECYRRITGKWNKEPLLMPAGAESQMLKKGVAYKEECKVYFPVQNGYSEKECIALPNENTGSALEYSFPIHKVLEGRIRLDPMDQGGIALENIQVKVERKGKAPLLFSGKDCYSSGYQYENWFVFPEPDPHLYFILPEPTEVETLHFQCNCERVLPEILIQLMLHNEGIASASLSYRGECSGGQIPGEYKVHGTKLQCSYVWFPKEEKLTELRFSPSIRGGIAVQNFTAKAYDDAGREVPLVWRNNGFRMGDSDIFLAEPAYGAAVPGAILARLDVELVLTGRISAQTANAFVPRWKRGVQKVRGRLARK